jgi:hypothetical protein
MANPTWRAAGVADYTESNSFASGTSDDRQVIISCAAGRSN